MMRRALDRAQPGVDMTVVEDGDAALRALEDPKAPFDLVLLDLHLPRMSGLQLLETLSAKSDRMPPVVVLTGSSSPEETTEARRLGAKSVVEVPCDLRRLQDLMRGVCRAYLRPTA